MSMSDGTDLQDYQNPIIACVIRRVKLTSIVAHFFGRVESDLARAADFRCGDFGQQSET